MIRAACPANYIRSRRTCLGLEWVAAKPSVSKPTCVAIVLLHNRIYVTVSVIIYTDPDNSRNNLRSPSIRV